MTKTLVFTDAIRYRYSAIMSIILTHLYSDDSPGGSCDCKTVNVNNAVIAVNENSSNTSCECLMFCQMTVTISDVISFTSNRHSFIFFYCTNFDVSSTPVWSRKQKLKTEKWITKIITTGVPGYIRKILKFFKRKFVNFRKIHVNMGIMSSMFYFKCFFLNFATRYLLFP